MDATSRELLWNIPGAYLAAMYGLFVLAAAVFAKGFYDKLTVVTGRKGLKELGRLKPDGLRWGRFLQTALLSGKATRKLDAAVFHSLVFFGFIMLMVATGIVAAHIDTPMKIFHGPVYVVVSFLGDIAGVAVLGGLLYAMYRRFVVKPPHLASSLQQHDGLMYALLLALILIGFLLEGLRIEGTRSAYLAGEQVLYNPREQYWSPVGWWVAGAVQSLGLSDSGLVTTWRALWLLHMLNTMAFIALIPYTRLAHVVLFPVAALVSRVRQANVLEPMDFEDENAETFGLGKVSELTARNRLDLLTCVECGRCTLACPANAAGKPIDPKRIITRMRDRMLGAQDDAGFWDDEPVFTPDELDSCTTCGACMEECPGNVEHIDLIMGAKRYKVLTLGDIPAAAADAVGKVQANGNPWGLDQGERFDWARGLDVKVAEPGKKIDYLYYVGCAAAYELPNRKVVRDVLALLDEAGVDFAVIGKSEKCNGDPVRRFGEEYAFTEIAVENIAKLNEYDFDKIIVHCPHCMHTIGKEYAKFEDGDFEVVHHTELLADLLKAGRLKPKKAVAETIAFHDPCYLGRHHGAYSAPRDILKAVPGLEVREMQRSKDRSRCCGLGGGNMWYEISAGIHLADKRLEDLRETQAAKIGTACAFCMINFNSSKGASPETEQLEVEDVASVLAKSVLDRG